jgi:DNA replication protein DnaC
VGQALRGIVPDAPTAPVAEAPAETVCPICKGAGWLRANVPVGDPFFGRAIPCECTIQERERRNADSLQRLSALDAFRNRTFENFDPKVSGVSDAYEIAREYASDPYGWLVLRGGVGSGKTHLAAAIANEAVRRQVPVLFAVVPDLLDHLRATFSPTSAIQYDEMFEGVRSTFLLVLDDLGTESATPWAQEKLFQLINHRYNNQLPTVITTNRRLESLDERIVSRLGDRVLCAVVEISARDYRALQKGQRRPGTPGREATTRPR